MANIKLSELNPVGSELFQDSENFLNELNDQEMDAVMGAATVNTVASQSIGTQASQATVSGGNISVSNGVSVVATLTIG
ncbi:hypothetical protein Sta7437_2212 [Stanieria cyanosphaera PCC 7437]|uniref:Uncharacterized protein n=1 Tax=Stanieria cyanosphaera (strain ATCC 29371 / PCC 7437) TaxID=111780 RepID=K9XT28_STAC7|nr:hypothetical protein [Stanieria cyanosphaera]AFZ35760.1 hypothetical protein Sta7437_2212 [Stanieria cyanosphaera PCC 7437]